MSHTLPEIRACTARAPPASYQKHAVQCAHLIPVHELPSVCRSLASGPGPAGRLCETCSSVVLVVLVPPSAH